MLQGLRAIKQGVAISQFGSRRMSSFASAGDILAQLELSSDNVNAGVFDGKDWKASGAIHEAKNPSTGEVIAKVQFGTTEDYQRCIESAVAAQEFWQNYPAPKRGEIVRQIGNALREKKDALGALLSLEMGKIFGEGKGEVQEFIDICDLACGMSRQLPGQIVPSERDQHVLFETWNPLGTVGIITAFNFPHAVFGWNASISLICGNTQIVKGAESASLVSIATQKVVSKVLAENGIPAGVAVLCQGFGKEVGEALLNDKRVNLVSFTGSTKVGMHVKQTVSARHGQTLLELGGNNAVLVMPSADMPMALQSILFAAAGTCGQRCTSLRRLLLHESVHDFFLEKLVKAYGKLRYGNPLDDKTLIGPIHNQAGLDLFFKTVQEAQEQGGKLLTGGVRVEGAELPNANLAGGNFIKPAIVSIDASAPIVQEERFVPVLYVCKVKDFDEAIKVNNSVEQGLSSALFSNDMREVMKWVGPRGSDTGIVNVNTSCSGAEIGLAFGGNKSTGWGRESGSDAWKAYMRRSSAAINYANMEGKKLELAQGINFSLDD